MRAEVDELGEVTYDNHKSFVYLTAVFLEVRSASMLRRCGLNCSISSIHAILTVPPLLRRLFVFILRFLACVYTFLPVAKSC
jgi:hypothetical protein